MIDGLVYFSKRINSLIGFNMSTLFGMSDVSLRRAEIYIKKSKGINCSYDLGNSAKWPLGKFVLDHLKSNTDKVFLTFTSIFLIKIFFYNST